MAKRKPGQHLIEGEREAVFEEVAKLDRRGYSKLQIAQRLGVSVQTVYRYVDKLYETYRQSTVKEIAQKIQEKLLQWRELRMVCWEEYERSRGDGQRTVEEEALRQTYKEVMVDGKKTRVPGTAKLEIVKRIKTVEGRLGASEYLRTIAQCLVEEEKLEGLIKGDANLNFQLIKWDQIVFELAGATKNDVDNAITRALPMLQSNPAATLAPNNPGCGDPESVERGPAISSSASTNPNPSADQPASSPTHGLLDDQTPGASAS